MDRPRFRIHYRKFDDLRWLGHQDLVRVWERLLRRADVRPAYSEGFHHRPRMNFPSALAVGIAAVDEVFELELEHDCEPAALAETLCLCAPPGLDIVSCERMPPGAKFSQPAGAVYEIQLPADRLEATRLRLALRRAATSGPQTADAAPISPPTSADGTSEELAPLPPTVRSVELDGDVLRMELQLGQAGAMRPRDLLALLGLGDLESAGAQLTRTRVETAG